MADNNKIKIAIFSPHRPFFGTTITQLPFLYALKQKYPNAQIDIWSKSKTMNLLKETEVVDNIIHFSKPNIYSLTQKLKQNKYQIIYNLHPSSLRIHVAIKLSGINQCYGLVSSNWHKKFYHFSLIDNKEAQYIAYRFLNLFNQIEKTNINPTIIANLTKNKPSNNNDLTIIPCGGGGDYKRWGIKNYCTTAKILLENKMFTGKVNFILGPDEAHYADIILETLYSNKEQVLIFQSPSIKKLIDIAKDSRLTLTNDCGPAHVFQMLETPIIMIFGKKEHASSPYKVLSEWYNCHEHSWTIFPNEQNKKIQSISTEKVINLAKSQLI